MYIVVRETKQGMGFSPHRHPLINTMDKDFMMLLEVARGRAEEHAKDVMVDKPIRFGNGFKFWTSNNSVVYYKVEEVVS